MLNNKGFTLIEIIAVLIIISILGVIATTRFIGLNTGSKMADQVVSELTTREKLTWSNIKISTYTGDIDAVVFVSVSYDVGAAWSSGPTTTGGTVVIDSTATALQRIPSDISKPATWQRR